MFARFNSDEPAGSEQDSSCRRERITRRQSLSLRSRRQQNQLVILRPDIRANHDWRLKQLFQITFQACGRFPRARSRGTRPCSVAETFSRRNGGLHRPRELAVAQRGDALGNSNQVSARQVEAARVIAGRVERPGAREWIAGSFAQSAHVLELPSLPFHHHDLFDRMLIAQAKHEGWEMVSKDPEFKLYPVRMIW
jgi:hypothetical protein